MTDAFKLDRRYLLTGAALGGAAPGFGTPSASFAAAPKQGLSRPALYRFDLGDFEVTTILDARSSWTGCGRSSART